MHIQSTLSRRFESLQGELDAAFARLREQVQEAQEELEGEIAQERAIAAALPDGADAKEDLESWLLKDAILSVPLSEKEETLPIGALILQQAAASEGTQLALRLNPHIMELSQRTNGAVEAVGKDRLKSSLSTKKTTAHVGTERHSNVADQVRQVQQKYCQPFMPNTKSRVAWDVCGMCLIVVDTFLLPVTMAWDLEISPFSDGSLQLKMFAALSMVFWPLDIMVNFNTAYYNMAHLETRRQSIAWRYLSTWLLFDVSVVAVDLTLALSSASEDMADVLQPLRSARYLRLLRSLRILRLMKAGKINVILENLVISMGRQWLILTFTVGKMLMTIFMVAHILACSWFGLGKVVSGMGSSSWIDIADVQEATLSIQYIHAMQWIITPPSPAPLATESGLERFAILMTVVITVLVIGTSLSLLTGTLQEIRQVNNERSKKRRELRIFLQTKAAPTELVMRVMSYADYKMARHSPIAYDESLISPKLEAELATFQRGSFLEEHPIFWLTLTFFPNVFADLCRSLEKQLYCEGEVVFHMGALAEMMYMSSHGDFAVGTEAKGEFHFSGPHRYFSEVALYVEAVMHDCRLSARSFCEVFVLDSDRMVHVLANSPVCAAMFIEYANEFVAKYSISAPNCHPEALLQQHIKLASQVCQNNSYYRELYVDESKLIENLNLAGLRSQVLLECAVGHHRSLSSYGSNSSPQEVLVNGHASMMKAMHKVVQKKSLESKEMAVEKVGEVHISPKEFVDEMLSPEVSMGMLVDKLRDAFVELDQAEGLHARYSDEKEQERAECGILSLICLARNDYEAFTKPQPEKARLAKAQWEQLRQLLAWTCPDNEKLLAAIFLLAVRGIGKCRPLQQQLPSQFQRPDQAVRYIIDNYPDAVPSSYSMTDRSQQLVADLLELQQNFIFAQMLQGENVPANLLQLKDFMNERSGMETLKFYVLYLLGFLSGLAGGVGSRFMTSSNAKSTLLGLSTLQHVLEKDPTALYWTYIFNRGVELQKRPVSTTDLALLRMACLVRAQNAESVDRLSGFMQQISVAEREELVKNFLADGIHSRAFVFEFLPLCFERAMKNAFVTVPRLLEVLVELLRAVRALAGPSFKGQTVPVDLSDLAAFILMVQNSYVFQTCLSRSKLKCTDGRFILEVTQDNWRRVSEPHGDMVMLAHSVREMAQSQRREKESLEMEVGTPLQPVMSCNF
ncbi:unnamed protein product [Effrenium voratum]|nr:unnamed protein product [Effrenium voratum]